MSKLFGTLAILAGAAVIGVAPAAIDTLILTLPSNYDVHLYDLVGAAFIVVGIILFWR